MALFVCILTSLALFVLAQPTLSLTGRDNIKVSFIFDNAIEISVSSDDVVIDGLMPGTFDISNEVSVNVATNSPAGLTLNAVIGDDDRPFNKIPSIHSNEYYFTGIDIEDEITEIPSGSWGFSLDHGATFSGLPAYNDEDNTKELLKTETITSEALPFLIGATAATDQQEDDYKNIVTFQAVANKVLNTIDKIIYMQDFDEDTFASMQYEKQYQLIDRRDEKKYFVTKLHDDNVWMTQNLDFDLQDGMTLMAEDSDVLADKTLEVWPSGSTYNDSPYFYYHNITQYDRGDRYCPGGYCNSESQLHDAAELSDDDVNNHYRLGNLYTYYAATAKSFEQCPNSNLDNSGYGQCMNRLSSMEGANESICPKGWGLPISGAQSGGNSASVYSLLSGIGLPGVSGSFTSGTRLRAAPSYFVANGYGYSTDSSTPYYSNYAYYWTATKAGPTNGFYYYVYYYQDYDYFYNYNSTNSMYYMYNVRCVAKPSSQYAVTYYYNDGSFEEPFTSWSSSKIWSNSGVDAPKLRETPLRNGYEFLGWGTSATSDSPKYGPNETIHLSSSNTKLYAVWKPSGVGVTFEEALTSAGKEKENGYYSMQDLDGEICKQVKVGESIDLRDTRNEEIYHIVKYSNGLDSSIGSCWMKDELRLGSKTDSITLTPQDSDVEEDFVMPAVAEWNYQDAYTMYNDDRVDTNSEKKGYLYNYNLATVGDYAAIVNDDTKGTDETYVTTHSICPKNWTLPSDNGGTINSELNVLRHAEPYYTGDTTSFYSDSTNPLTGLKLNMIMQNFVKNYMGYMSVNRRYNYDTGNYELSSELYDDNYQARHFTKSFSKYTNQIDKTDNSVQTINYSTSEIYTNSTNAISGVAVRCMIPIDVITVRYVTNDENDNTDSVSIIRDSSGSISIAIMPKITMRKTGYEFLGWATTSSATSPEYQNNDTFTIGENVSNVTFYGLWGKIGGGGTSGNTTFNEAFADAGVEKFGEKYYAMQDITPEICDAVSNGEQGRLIDKRDNKVYWVVRLENLYDGAHTGTCWMTQNLDFALSTTAPNILSPETSDVETEKTFQLRTGTDSDNITQYIDGGDYYLRDGGLGMTSEAPYLPKLTPDSELSEDDIRWHYHIGSYYGYGAATLIQNRYDVISSAQGSPESICPKGWRLPYAFAGGGQAGSFEISRSYRELQEIINSTNAGYNNKFYSAPYYPTAVGYSSYVVPPNSNIESVLDNYFYGVGERAFYWTANMAYHYSDASAAVFMQSSLDSAESEDIRVKYSSYITNYSLSTYYANSVRCVAR